MVMATIFRHTNNAWKCAKAFRYESKDTSVDRPFRFSLAPVQSRFHDNDDDDDNIDKRSWQTIHLTKSSIQIFSFN